MRRLVVSCHVTVANYEYLVYWRFYQDGNIECEVRATGIMVTTPFAGDERAALRHGRRHADLRADPPALHHRPPRHGGRRAGQHRRHDRDRAAADRPGQPVRPRARPALRAAAHRAEGSRTSTGPPSAPGRSPTRTCATRSARAVAYKLVPGAAVPPMLDPSLPGAAPRPGAGAHAVGHPVRPRGALAVRRVRQPERRGRGPPGVDRGRPLDRQHRRRALVHLRHPPRPARRGLADHAGRHGVVLAQAHRVLRPQPVPGRRAVTRAPTASATDGAH